jgi:phosphoribosylaminoimidazole-succinocarboxamide synthase
MLNGFEGIDLPELGQKESGKVRDIYHQDGQRILITTDRFSAFDRMLDMIPGKGQVLNQLSAWWFEQTRAILPNHLISVPDPNVSIVHEAQALPIEVVVRGYITGVTSTSLWTLYEAGHREVYGVTLPEGLKKNDKLPSPVLTPTTKASGGAHDERLTPTEIIERGLLDEDLWQQVAAAALAIFQGGSELAWQAGLTLVDTKYEFGLHSGQLILIDELHTPDSSRYWLADDFSSIPQNYDKEFLRLWLVEQGFRGDGELPIIPDEIITEVANRYITVYEKLTGKSFVAGDEPIEARIRANLGLE